MQQLKIMISGGGTGGHVFPAIAIADAIKKQVPQAIIHFVGAEGKMEMEKVPEAGYPITGLWISGLQRSLSLKNLTFPFKLFASLIKAYRLVSEFKPNVAVGVGGYASGPLLRIAAMRGIPTVLQEQNSFPGLTNRILAKKANKICVAYPNMERFFEAHKIVYTGNPTRKTATQIEGMREKAQAFFKLNPNKKTVLAIGGSLGARTINESIKKAIPNWIENDIQVIWQTGKFYQETVNSFLKELNSQNVFASAFIKEMNLAYAAADIIVSRAGAISVSELCLIGKPMILIPSPNVSEDHQTKNAKSLVDKNAALLISDHDAPLLLEQTILNLIKDTQKCKALGENASALATPNADEHIANIILNLAKH